MDIFARGSGIADIEEAIPFRFICNEFWKSRSQSIQRCIWILQRTLEIGSPYQFLPHPPFLCHATRRWNIWPHKFQPKRNQWKTIFCLKSPTNHKLVWWIWKVLALVSEEKNSEWILAVTCALMDQPKVHVNHYHTRPSWFATTFASLKHSTERKGQLWK